MNQDQAVLNRIWCETLFEALYRHGVRDVCVAPGSRSTPLTLEANAHPDLLLHTHFDERGLGFLALGLAKASHRPVAVVVTSGTAVANLLPAVAEAGLTGEKLVLLTADRPIERVGCGANQAIVQPGIFSAHVSGSLNLPSPTLQTPLSWLLTSVDQLMQQQALLGQAVHINCPFPEPLYSQQEKSIYQSYLDAVAPWRVSGERYCHQVMMPSSVTLSAQEVENRKGLVIIGSVPSDQALHAFRFAQIMGWPVLCDPQSGLTSNWCGFDVWLQNPSAASLLSQSDLVVQFGSRIVSKRLNHWLEKQISPECDYWYISAQRARDNQSHLPQRHYVCRPEQWVNSLVNEVTPASSFSGWGDDLTRFSSGVMACASEMATQSLSELAIAHQLGQLVGAADLFLGNSLFVRLVDMVAQLSEVAVFSNRGASGIDGLFATACGVQRARQKPMLMMIGDLSALYDLNSLALFTHLTTPVVVIVTNNDGGAIFDLLPVPEQEKQALYQMPHGYHFEHAAKQFGLAYQQPKSWPALHSIVNTHFESGSGVLLLEVRTPCNQASEQITQLVQAAHALS